MNDYRKIPIWASTAEQTGAVKFPIPNRAFGQAGELVCAGTFSFPRANQGIHTFWPNNYLIAVLQSQKEHLLERARKDGTLTRA
jgi:hypothetical protein